MGMTEAEFENVISEELLAALDDDSRSIAEVVKRAARRAGLEFASELPERLNLSACGTLAGPGEGPSYGCFELTGICHPDYPDRAHRKAVLAEAVRRYNEFPATLVRAEEAEAALAGLRKIVDMPESLEREKRLESAAAAGEGLPLPARLECGSTLNAVIDLWPERSRWACFTQRRAGYQAACDRYNAYPGLWKAAEWLIRALAPQSRINLESAISLLKAELAKRLKP